ncbi:hypothetical protein SAMN05192573_1126 [Mucilaginibacter gossypii]|uniref:Uncharacterized protein n=1 Tax=Mucilaginibacter gossypii TaxID=551996 RepID=A0A1G8EPD8_9SPHI|nr:hypothetical protein SAMN05192573_1126 [Mucilaginibacter gossypii]
MGIDMVLGDCAWGALDCSVKPGARREVAGRKGEDLQRKARAGGNAIV